MLLLRSAPDPCTAENNSFQARLECVGKNTGEQKPIPPRMQGPCLWKYGQNEQRVTPVPLSRRNIHISKALQYFK